MIDLIGRLIERGHAYVDGGTVYYDVTSFPDYGRLSRNSLDQLRAGHRLEAVDHHKRHPADFILWKAAGPRRVVRFDSPWGEGYPGWHIECSAMSIAYLGERFDIHTGGVDLTFPHHEDEIAQSEGALGHPVVTTWVHGDHLLFSGQKMAKSSGNVWTLDRLEEEGHQPLDFRYLCLTSRYRRQLRFSPDALAAAGKARSRLGAQLADWGDPAAGPGDPGGQGVGQPLPRRRPRRPRLPPGHDGRVGPGRRRRRRPRRTGRPGAGLGWGSRPRPRRRPGRRGAAGGAGELLRARVARKRDCGRPPGALGALGIDVAIQGTARLGYGPHALGAWGRGPRRGGEAARSILRAVERSS